MFIDILAHPDLKKYDLSSLRKGKSYDTMLIILELRNEQVI